VNRAITRFGLALLVLYTAVFAQLNNLQLFGAKRLNQNPINVREAAKDFERKRGSIITADGVVVAESTETPGGVTARVRTYSDPLIYAPVTGYFSRDYGASGIEREYNDELAAKTDEQKYGNLSDLFSPKDRTGDVTLTIDNDVQRAAAQALLFRKGSVVAIDPRDGSILALYSFPTYDPNTLSTPDRAAATTAKKQLDLDPAKPLLTRAYRDNFFPGSTFKVVTSAAGLQSGAVTRESPVFAAATNYVAPLTNTPLRNFGGETCGGTLFEILRDSCNSAYARMGAEYIGPDALIARASAFGFNDTPPIDLPDPIGSNFPTDYGKKLQTVDSFYAKQNGQPPPTTVPDARPPVYVYEDTPKLAQVSIGQNDVRATPLQMALVAAAVANDGVIMKPHVMKQIRTRDGSTLRTYAPDPWRTAVSPDVAATLREAMVGVVEGGTATRMAIDGFVVGGKTGTAELGTTPASSHAWIIGFAGPPGQPATVAVAVIVEAQPGADEQTGGRVAAPIAKTVLEAALRAR
jgi:penicillin-binding protein A